MLVAEELTIGFDHPKNRKELVTGIRFTLERGKLLAVVGRNGTGKTTLVRTLARLLNPLSGNILLDSLSLRQFTARQLATRLSIVHTGRFHHGYLTVADLVGMGRYLYTGWTGLLSEEDKQVVDTALQQAGGSDLKDKTLAQLSDGEHQKAMIARAIAQQTPLMLLDEPTAHLDLISRIEIIQLLKKLVQTDQLGILFSTHEVELALQYADEVLLLDGKGGYYLGPPDELVRAGHIAEVYRHDLLTFDPETRRFKDQ